MDINLITIARRANLGPRIVKSYKTTIEQIENVEAQYWKIKEANIFNNSELLFNRKISFIGVVSLLEQYLFSIHTEILQSFPKKLGNDKFDIDEVLEEGGLLPAISKKAVKKVLDAAYGTFNKQIAKIKSAYDISDEFDENLLLTMNEIKCSRDVYTHSPESKVNAIYLQKVGIKARERENVILKLDEQYFIDSITTIKLLLSTLFDKIPNKYKDSNMIHVFKQMWESTCLNRRVSFDMVWETEHGSLFLKELHSDFGFSSSEMEVYKLFRYIFSYSTTDYQPNLADYFLRWKPSSREAQIAYSWLDCQFYF